jgi:hypothetical protein
MYEIKILRNKMLKSRRNEPLRLADRLDIDGRFGHQRRVGDEFGNRSAQSLIICMATRSRRCALERIYGCIAPQNTTDIGATAATRT